MKKGTHAKVAHTWLVYNATFDMRCFGIALLLSITALISGCNRKDYATGEAVYKGECAKCHILNGSGGTKGPDLSGVFEKHDERYVRKYTVDPRSLKPDSTMPPAELDENELEMLIEYLKENARKRSSSDQSTQFER